MAQKNEFWYAEQETEAERSLSTPFANADMYEGDEESTNDKKPSRLKLYVAIAVGALIIIVGAVMLGLYLDRKDKDDYTNTCYIAPSCENVNPKQVYNLVTGYTNNTGFSMSSNNDCCNICIPGSPQTVCFDIPDADLTAYRSVWGLDSGYTAKDKNCTEKTGNQDYDYVLLDQIYFPQWCTALDSQAHDPTLSHLQGTRCTAEVVAGPPLLNIHGFWPNYYHGFPQCCTGTTGSDSVAPLVPGDVQNWGALYTNMQQLWNDPTTSSVNSDDIACSTCYLQNHEWEKHGSCFSADPKVYFSSGIAVAQSISALTEQVTAWHGTTVPTALIASIYPNKVNILCDPQAPAPAPDTGVFLELQTCWNSKKSTLTLEDVLLSSDIDTSDVGDNIRSRVYYDKSSGALLGHTVADVKQALLGVDRLHEVELLEFESTDCIAANAGQFTAPCSTNTFIGDF